MRRDPSSPRGLAAWMGRAAALAWRHPVAALVLGVLVTAGAAVSARQLALDADLAGLLPRSFPSVQALDRLEERFGGIGYVVVVGRSEDPAALRRFADEVGPRLEALPEVRYVDWKRPKAFFEAHGLYYLELDDLEEVHRRLRERERWERRQRNPLYIQLDEEPAPSLDFSDLEEAYAASAQSRLAGDGDAYYLDEEEGLVALLAKPWSSSADLGNARELVDAVEAALAREDLSRFAPDLTVDLTGTYKKKLDQQAQIARDIAVASTLALLLMLGYLLLHFRSAVAVGMILVPVGTGVAWTYGLAGAAYGSVNILTGFLGAILGGLGLEHGIHLLGRYERLRAAGRPGERAVRAAFSTTGAAAAVSALVAALTFAGIAVSRFRAFREFGLIAAFGMVAVLTAYLLLLPVLLKGADRWGWRPPRGRSWLEGLAAGLGARLARRHRAVTAVGLVVMAALVWNAGSARFDYDFAALEDGSLPSFVLDRKVNRILGYSQTPVFVLTDDAESEAAARAALERRKEHLGEASSVDFVAALGDLVPDRQREKRPVLRRIGRILDRVDPATLEAEDRERFDTLREAAAADPFTRADLPVEVRRQFEGVGREEGGFVLVFPRVSLADGRRVRALAHEVRGLPPPLASEVTVAGEAMVLADILDMVSREAPVVLAAAVASVLVALWLTLGALSTALLALTPTLLSVLGLAGLMPLLGLPFNYLNILAVPVLIGTTVDASVHLLTRISDTGGRFEAAWPETARGVAGGLITSAVGFGALVLADHPGLASLGEVALLGVALNLLVTLVLFPSVLLWMASPRKAGCRSRSRLDSGPETP